MPPPKKTKIVLDPVMDVARGVITGSDESKAVRLMADGDLDRLREAAKLMTTLVTGEMAARQVRREGNP